MARSRSSRTSSPHLRVIAGQAGGRRLVAPPHVRPTTERVREAVFSALGGHVVDAAVLDLYAGSGAMAIEALSRGAARAVLVDHDRAAVEACRDNLVTTRLAARARIQRLTVEDLLGRPPPPEAAFDLVLVDPPYDAAPVEIPAVLAGLARPGWLHPDARVVLETAAGPALEPGPGFHVRSSRRYGDTLITTLIPVLGA
jgi:16S rRNA (guanine966-N2)-methyltransferase